MRMEFENNFICFVAPEGFEVQATSDASYCLRRSGRWLNIVIGDRTDYECARRHIEQSERRFQDGAFTGWALEDLKRGQHCLDGTVWDYCEVRMRYRKNVLFQIDIAMRSPKGYCRAQYLGDEGLSQDELMRFMSTFELREAVPEPRTDAADYRKWKDAVRSAIRSNKSDDLEDKRRRPKAPVHPNAPKKQRMKMKRRRSQPGP